MVIFNIVLHNLIQSKANISNQYPSDHGYQSVSRTINYVIHVRRIIGLAHGVSMILEVGGNKRTSDWNAHISICLCKVYGYIIVLVGVRGLEKRKGCQTLF